MLRVVASFGVVEPLQDQLGSGGWWQKLCLKQGRHGLENLTHFELLLLRQLQSHLGLLAVLVASKQAVVL